MSAIDDLSAAINRMTGGNSGNPQFLKMFKSGRVGASAAAATIAGRYTDLWEYNGTRGRGSAPGGTPRNPTNTTDGSLKHTDASGGRTLYIVGGFIYANVGGVLIIYDRLADVSGLSGTTTTAQTFTLTPTRYTNGLGNEIWINVYTQIGATGTTATVSYTDDAGNSGQTSDAFVIGGTGFREAQRILPVPLLAGDIGVQAVANVDLVATTGTAGDFGVSLVHPLLETPIIGVPAGCIRPLMLEANPIALEAGASLACAWIAQGTAAPEVRVALQLAEF
jgi:hypothetical protein